MAMDKATFMERARQRSETPDDYWDWIVGMVKDKPGIGITDRKHYSQKQWNTLQNAKVQLTHAYG